MNIVVDERLSLDLITGEHALPIFDLVDRNRDHLRAWLPFVDKMLSVEIAEDFVRGTMGRNRDGIEYAFVIVQDKEVIGRVGVYKIDNQNRAGEIGYWISENSQGRGIVTNCCRAMVDFCFNELALHRIEICCQTGNQRSKRIPERLNFTKEGVLRQAEFVRGKYFDLDLYSLLSTDKR